MREQFVDIVEPERYGVRLVIDPSDPFQLEIWLGTYQPHVVSFLAQAIRPGATVLCAGLHVGYVVGLARAVAGAGGRVLSAEPDAAARERARRNLALQIGAAPVDIFDGGLSDADGALTLHRSAVLGHSSFACEHQPLEETSARVVQGDRWLEELGVRHLDVIVLDVEGWELQVLRGMRATISRSRSLVALIELTEWALRGAGTTSVELVTFLRESGFEVRWVTQYGAELPFGVWGPVVEDPSEARSNDVLCIRP
jgi:FkbM family methyltransferase